MANTTTVLIAGDFYNEYELYETNNIDDLKSWFVECWNGNYKPLDTTKHALIGSQDDICTDDAIKQADITIYVADLIS